MWNTLPIDELHKLLRYDPLTGKLYWRDGRQGGTFKGEAGYLNDGYLRVIIDGIKYAAGRICYALYHDEWPEQEVDHWDRNKLNNKISNLRDVSPMLNCQNKGMQTNNTSGKANIDFNGSGWRARVTRNKKSKFLGRFSSREAAESAIKEYLGK